MTSNPGYPTLAGLYTYSVTVTDANGCTDVSSVDVQFNSAPPAIPDADVTNAIFCSSNKGQGSAPVKPIDYSTSTLRVDISNACADVTLGGGPTCAGVGAAFTEIRWFENAVGGNPLFDADTNSDGINDTDKDGDQSTFDPVAAGLVDPHVPGIFTFYVEAACSNSAACTTPTRTPVTITILDCSISEGLSLIHI